MIVNDLFTNLAVNKKSNNLKWKTLRMCLETLVERFFF